MGKQNIVAILGRPNVGKSSIFNRFVGKRYAIVDEEAGVTRDRHYGVCSWTGKHFTIIDTGGYLPDSQELFDIAIREQVEIAIEQADILLFVLDVQTGITKTDQDIAKLLKHLRKKRIYLAINKVDDERYDHEIYSFYKLGLGDPIPISAISGRQSGDLLDKLVEGMSDEVEEDENRISLAVIGKENVGKSSYVNTILGENRSIVTDIAGTTRDSSDSLLRYYGQEFTIIDTAGLKRKTKVKENILFYSQLRTIYSIEKCHLVLYFIDAIEGITKQDQRLITTIIERQKGLIIVVNKWDLIENKTDKLFQNYVKELKYERPEIKNYPIVMISTLKKQRVHKVLDLAIKVNEKRKNRIPTSQLNDFYLPLIKAKRPPSAGGRDIKIKYVSQVESNPPIIAFFCNKPDYVAAHYKRFLENKFRENFNFEGVPVRFVYRRKNTEWEDTRA